MALDVLLPCIVEWTGYAHVSPDLSPQQLVRCAGDILSFAYDAALGVLLTDSGNGYRCVHYERL